MKGTKKRVVIILCIVVALLALELGREYVSYRMTSNKFESSYWRLQGRTGMTKEEVRSIVGEPEQVEMGAADENWYWYAHNHRGPLWKLFTSARGYELNVQFDKTGRMLDVYSKVN
jgi:outer membrane protein assembly factor BamE (lipoprotein component of BamABCDE complex)